MKKKIVLCSALCLALSVSAQSKEDTIEKVYYGTKARKSTVNPCKGAIVDVCAKVIKHISMVDTSLTMVEATLMDKEGNVVFVDVQYDNRPYQIIKEDLERQGFTNIGDEFPEPITPAP